MPRKSRKRAPDINALMLLEMREIHGAENQLRRKLPRLAKAADSDSLRKMIERRLDDGERIIQALEKGFGEMDEKPKRAKNPVAEGLIEDAQEHIKEFGGGPALDAVLVADLQKTEHYCIAAWGTVRSLAQQLQRRTVANAMERALRDGKMFDEELTSLAEQEFLPMLQEGEADMEEEMRA